MKVKEDVVVSERGRKENGTTGEGRVKQDREEGETKGVKVD